jgi:hypothetical protein
MAATNKCLAQSNKSGTGSKATKKRRSLPGSAAHFRALATLANGKTRYRVSAAGYFMTLVREFASQEAGPPGTAIAAIRRRTKSTASTGSGSI